ncbi:IS110 family transposase [Nitratireductor alexandrii]|uniref:IS110 family transposase n=1 Tax=Nitratireductor alexandrii TaxID=2448161 RepID=UPI001EE80562|nr:transposase [Nitratireductor alexandrii]
MAKVNPLQARRFAQACGTRVKTDAVDACLLTRMGSAPNLAPDRPVAENQHALKELQVAGTALFKEKTRLKKRLKTQSLAFTQRQTAARIDQVARKLKALRGEIEAQLRFRARRAPAHDILRSIPDTSEIAAAILIECPKIGTLGQKTGDQSSRSRSHDKTIQHVAGKGIQSERPKFLRDALYMSALVAARFNPDMARKYKAMTAFPQTCPSSHHAQAHRTRQHPRQAG